VQNPVQLFGVLEEALCGDYVERLRPDGLDRLEGSDVAFSGLIYVVF
jgi:hypothetical protein